jgi:hypothetical protein
MSQLFPLPPLQWKLRSITERKASASCGLKADARELFWQIQSSATISICVYGLATNASRVSHFRMRHWSNDADPSESSRGSRLRHSGLSAVQRKFRWARIVGRTGVCVFKPTGTAGLTVIAPPLMSANSYSSRTISKMFPAVGSRIQISGSGSRAARCVADDHPLAIFDAFERLRSLGFARPAGRARRPVRRNVDPRLTSRKRPFTHFQHETPREGLRFKSSYPT